MELSELYKGKPTKIRNKTYLSTEQYVKPFIEKISNYTKNYKIVARGPEQVSLTEDKEDLVYNRILITAYMPDEFDQNGYTMAICYSYALDAKKPIYKLYKTYVDKKSLNFVAFDQCWLVVGELKNDEAPSLNIKDLIEKPGEFDKWLKQLDVKTNRKAYECRVGAHLTTTFLNGYNNGFHLVKLSGSDVLNAFKNMMLDKDSEIYVPLSKDFTLLDIYNAYSGLICNDPKDIFNRFEKLLIIKTFIL